MKFLIAVLAVRFLISVLASKENKGNVQNSGVSRQKVHHPAEFEVR